MRARVAAEYELKSTKVPSPELKERVEKSASLASKATMFGLHLIYASKLPKVYPDYRQGPVLGLKRSGPGASLCAGSAIAPVAIPMF